MWTTGVQGFDTLPYWENHLNRAAGGFSSWFPQVFTRGAVAGAPQAERCGGRPVPGLQLIKPAMAISSIVHWLVEIVGS